jgi:hypothetical protein
MDSEKKVLTPEELTVNIAPNPKCKYCYGRGSEGRNVLTNRIVLCRCVVKKIERLKRGKINVRSLRAPEQGRDNPSVEERREGSGGIRLSDFGGEEKRLGSSEKNASERGEQKEQGDNPAQTE